MEQDLNVKHLHHYTCAICDVSQPKIIDLYWETPPDWYDHDAIAHFNARITELW